ncbi:30S ribosomal protein S21 [Rhizobium laguerreae]|uniref:30S ribosomal protein S21 n=1 Tax=Rhizobium laguerreae TaxID=1076926 RepID=UPI001C8FB8BE|nr:30S ribosomal protein S21 [Rhizobium laguerreae]MBY3151054.1 30S ribosomal protein S21 [Rhizobium laguerreae]MBY3433245.1 30S ribosomal protein S21 [Rhizobium laguerreae]
MKVIVRNGDVNQALRVMKRKLQQEGVFREMRTREAYEKPSDKRRREKGEAVRRKQRELRKRQAAERSGR